MSRAPGEFDRPSGRRRGAGGRGENRPDALRVPTFRTRRARLALLAAATALGMLSLAARCVHLQILKAGALLDVARAQHEKAITLDPLRGPILDRNGRELALSLDVDSIYADPRAIRNPAATARRLASVVGLDPAALRERLEEDRNFAWIKRKIAPALRERVEALGLEGIGFVRESRRYYPKQALAAHVLGACGVDNQGLAGLESFHDDAIKGVPGRILFLRDGRGERVLDRSRIDAVPGSGLRLTLDVTIQHIAEREIDAAVAETRAAGAAVVVLEPRSGEILALASRPTFDPHRFPQASAAARPNRAVENSYEPGSTFKVITAAAALDAGRVRPDETIWCENGSIVVGRHRFDEDRLPFGNLTLTEVLAKSSNVGAIKIARRLGPGEFLDAIRRFGFGLRTGIDLPGESVGMLRDVSAWSGLSQASLSMGQEIGATPVQLAAAMGAIANDGVWTRPHVVGARLTPARGALLPTPADEGPRSHRAVSTATARSLRRMLQSVTSDGTGRAAAVAGYSVGGKTGTAQKIDAKGRYSPGRYVAWYAGFVPADHPALVVVVMVDEPRGAKTHGGDVAAPVFSRIAGPVLRYLGVAPDREGTLVFDASVLAGAPRVEGRRAADAAVAAVRRDGRGAVAARVRPRDRGPGRDAAAGRAVPAVRLVQASLAGLAADAGSIMPDLVGLSLRRASETLAAAGLTCAARLRGALVTRQEPEAGGPLPDGGRCLVVY